jgi:hypothetical protein
VAPAPKFGISSTVTTGTGISVASSGGGTLTERSPTFLSVEVGFTHPSLQWLEVSPGLLLEVEGRVGVGLNPKLRAILPLRRVRLYGFVGLPVFVAPYSLVGAQAGPGLAIHVHKHFAFVGEASTMVYFWGSDLMDDSILAKFDLALGLRVVF